MATTEIRGTEVGDQIISRNSDDVIMFGLGGDDWLQSAETPKARGIYYGGAGADRLFDTVSNGVWVYGEDGDDSSLVVQRGEAWIYGGNGDDLLSVVRGSVTTGRGELDGGVGNDDISAEGFNMSVAGGVGNDSIYVAGAGNTLKFGYGDGVDTLTALDGALKEVNFSEGVTYNSVALRSDARGVEIVVGGDDKLIISPNSIEGAPLEIEMFGDGYEETVFSFATQPHIKLTKADLLAQWESFGNDSSQLYYGINGRSDKLSSSGGDDTIYGLGGNDTINGGGGFDSLDGGSGDDSISGGEEDDLLLGGAGRDLLFGDSGKDSLNGGDDDDRLQGGAAADTLLGAVGIDTLIGGEGDDVYHVDNSADTVIEEAEQGQDEVYASASYVLSAHVEYGELTGTANLNLTGHDQGAQLWGNAGSNRITGGKGADELSGGFGGLDTMIGGAADDLYYVLNQTDALVEKAGEGFDEALALISGYRLADNVESLRLLSNMSVGYGNNGDNVISGNGARNAIYGLGGDDLIMGYGGNDTLTAGSGSDILSGGAGDDVYVYSVGDGEDEIMNYDAKGVDTLVIHGATESQVWFESSGKDLYISVIGQEGGVGITKWNLGGTYQVDLIKLDNGKTLSAGSVANLVNAMSSFTPPAIGQTTLPTNYQAALGATIAQNWVA